MPGAALPLVAFLLGSLPISLWIGLRWGGRDVREIGSGNPGATNVLRAAGRLPALLALAGDMAKGALPMMLGHALEAEERYLAATALAAVLGHVFSPWLGFRGGKGVATAFGGFSILAPRVAVLAAALFLAVVYKTRYVSLGSISAVLAFPLIWLVLARLGWEGAAGMPALAASAMVGALILWRHADNIRRLRDGVEARIDARVLGESPEART